MFTVYARIKVTLLYVSVYVCVNELGVLPVRDCVEKAPSGNK